MVNFVCGKLKFVHVIIHIKSCKWNVENTLYDTFNCFILGCGVQPSTTPGETIDFYNKT